jgi:hypothetical protein
MTKDFETKDGRLYKDLHAQIEEHVASLCDSECLSLCNGVQAPRSCILHFGVVLQSSRVEGSRVVPQLMSLVLETTFTSNWSAKRFA